MTWFNVKFIFDNDNTQHLSYYVEALDIIEAESKAFEKLGENGKKHKTSAEITPIVLNLTLGKPGKKYKDFKDQMADDPKIVELAAIYLRGSDTVKAEIKNLLDQMFAPLGAEYQTQALSTVKMVAGFAACIDFAKHGKTPYLEDWVKKMEIEQKTGKICPQCKKSFILGFADFCSEKCFDVKMTANYMEKHN